MHLRCLCCRCAVLSIPIRACYSLILWLCLRHSCPILPKHSAGCHGQLHQSRRHKFINAMPKCSRHKNRYCKGKQRWLFVNNIGQVKCYAQSTFSCVYRTYNLSKIIIVKSHIFKFCFFLRFRTVILTGVPHCNLFYCHHFLLDTCSPSCQEVT